MQKLLLMIFLSYPRRDQRHLFLRILRNKDAKTCPLGSVGLSPSDHGNGGGSDKEVQSKETSASSGKLASPTNLEQTALPKVARSYARCSKRANVSGEGVIIRDPSKARSSTALDAGAPNQTSSKDPEVEDFYPEPVKLDPVGSRQYIQLHANGKKVIGMPDTGATVNFMSTKMYQREFSHLPLRQKSMHQILGVTNTDREKGSDTTGIVQLRMHFCGKVINTNFLVGKSHDDRVLILGQKWQDKMMLNVGYDLTEESCGVHG